MCKQELILIRGIPGSGKSTLAKKICQYNYGYYHIEADMYFIRKGTYQFIWQEIEEAHNWCKERTVKYLNESNSVVVSNTFTQLWEMSPYFDIAKQFKIKPYVLLMQNNFDNIHGVNEKKLKKMINRFEYDISSLYEGLNYV